MKCANCQFDNREGAKFCNECGSSLANVCSRCRTENPAGAKFCNECGERLGSRKSASAEESIGSLVTESGSTTAVTTPTEAERRQLTVMFCDLVGSTEMSQGLDPEDLREMVVEYQESCARVVEHFGGSVAQYLGDGILVYFGYPVAHEDDALRAVWAALGILQAMEHLNQKLKSEKSLELSVRIGLHTGKVVVGDVGGGQKREQLALGDTPNIAARVQGVADENAIAISAHTHRLTEGFFDTKALGPHSLKGVAEDMEIFQVIQESGVRHRLEIEERGKTPYVGREIELETMMDAWQSAKDGKGRAFLINAEAGMGKSRLVKVFKEQAGATGHVLQEAFCSPYFGNSALHPIIELLRTKLALTRDDDNKKRLAKLRTYLTQIDMNHGETVPLLASLLSIPPDAGYMPLNLSPQAQRQKTLEILVSTLLRSSLKEPTLFVMEDLHWIDPSTLDLLNLMVEKADSQSALILLTARPSFDSPWRSTDGFFHITLNNLPRSQTESLIKGVTGGKSIPEEVQSALVAKSDGIPLFIEEMTKMVLEGGMLELVDDKYVLAGSLPDLDIPATLQDSLMARLDRMEAGAKKVAQVGACIGREFSIELTNAVVPGEESALRRGLGRLVEAQLVFAAQGQSTESYSFKHALIQDAAYESLLKRTRHEYHGRIAETLERDFPELTETQPEQLALHYAKAGQPEKAIPYWLKAGQKAVASSANAEAVNHLKQGLALLDELPENMERIQQKITFLSTLGTALSAIQGYASDEVKRTYARARELCEEIGQTPQLFWVYWGLWAFHLVRAEHHEAVMFGDKMMSLAKQQKDLSLELEAHFSLGLSYFFMGNLKPARKHLEKAVSIYEPEKHHANAYLTIQDVGVTSRSVAALCLWHLGETDLALERSGQALTLAEELAHPYSKAYALGCASWFNLYLRDIQTAEHHAHNAVELSIEQGFIWWLIWGTILGGRAMADSGEASTSVAQMKEGIEGWRKTGSAFTIPYFLALLSEACAADGQTEDALNLVAEARTLVEKTGEGFFEAELHRLTGELLSRLEQKEAMKSIEDCYRRAYDIARVQGAKALELRASMSLGRFWHEQGKTEEAHHILSDTLSWFEGRAKTRDVLDARELLQSFQVKQGTRPQRHAPRRKQSAVSSQPE